MKKNLFFLTLLCAFSITYAQNLRKAVNGTNGLSNMDVQFEKTQQPAFSLASLKTDLGLDANADLVLYSTESDKLGFTHYRFHQTYLGIPIENSMYIVHVKNGKITGVTGEIVTQFASDMTSKKEQSVQPEIAKTVAINFVHAKRYAWEDQDMETDLKAHTGNPNATYQPKSELVWFSDGDNINPSKLELAYKVEIYSLEPRAKTQYFVSTSSGQILGKKERLMHSDVTGTANTLYSGTQTIHSDLVSSTYYLRDYSRGNGIVTKNAATSGYPVFTNTSANWSLTTPTRNALDIHWGFEMTYDYYKNKFGRNGLNGSGLQIVGYTNDPNTTDNAYWDGSAMWFGKRSGSNNGVTGIDVIGHELTHGVTQYTCNLNYSNEPGAMNESLSDIMGKSVQFVAKPTDINWVLSNDMGWSIRSFSNPNAYSQPDTYKGTSWYSGTADNGGVHYNSGVGNFMFYLLVNGGSGTNDKGSAYSVSGIGLDKADQIIYRSQTVYLVSTSNYAAWRTACINAATDLYGASSAELAAVQNAFYAVGIGSAASTSCGTPGGLASSSITTTGATVSWTAVSGATSYTLQYKTSAATTWTTVSSITTTSKALSGLTAGTTYNWQVSATCSSGTSAYTASTFTTTSSTSSCGAPGGLASSSITTTGATVSWTAVSGATSYTLQYKTSAATTWTTVSSITTTSKALTGLTAGTTYNWQVSATCSSSTSAYTASTFTTTSSTTTSYCTSNGTSQSYEWIDLIKIGSINRTSTKETGGYVNTGLSTNLVIGSTNDTIRFSSGFTSTIYTEYWKVYIDFNKNGVFTDAGENVVSGTTTGSGTYYSVFSVPAGLTAGSTRMRVVMSDASTTTSCGSFSYGETEDYTINLTTSLNSVDNGIPSENSGIIVNAQSKTVASTEPVVTKQTTIKGNFTIYPNPANADFTTINFKSTEAGIATVRLINMLGQTVLQNTIGEINEGENEYKLTNLSSLEKGIYMLLLDVNGQTVENGRLSIMK